jgi:hypothetical protein
MSHLRAKRRAITGSTCKTTDKKYLIRPSSRAFFFFPRWEKPVSTLYLFGEHQVNNGVDHLWRERARLCTFLTEERLPNAGNRESATR